MLAAALAALALGAPAADQAQPPPEPHWRVAGCAHGHRSAVARRRIRLLLHNHRPATLPRGRRAEHYARCVSTRAKARAGRRLLAEQRAWRRQYAHRWPIALNRQDASWREWARSTAECEGDPDQPWIHDLATGSTYHGTFQFLLSTWAAAGGQGDPHEHSYAYQAVIAIGLAQREGTGHWPDCG